jgi:hypothetical protein
MKIRAFHAGTEALFGIKAKVGLSMPSLQQDALNNVK